MSDLQDIRRRLVDEGKLQDIYEAMGCEYVSYGGGRIEAQLPPKYDSHNKRAVQTKLNNSLTSSIRVPIGFHGGSIFDLVSFLVHGKSGEDEYKSNLHEAKRFICETLGWVEYLKGGEYKTKKDYVAPLKALLKNEPKRREVIPNTVLPDDVMNQFYYKGNPLPWDAWIKEGISYDTQVMYGVGFDWDSHRVVYPLKNRFGQIVGVKGRIMKDEDAPNKKYLYVYRCNNRFEWFNFHFALPYIQEQKKVYIFESEKSCMKMFEHGIYNTLAIGASDMSPEQADILKALGLDVEIVLCYDKGISVEDITRQAELYRGREIYYMYDIDGLLEGEKSAPVDEGIDIWNELVKDYIFEVDFEILRD
jgi:DNA primase